MPAAQVPAVAIGYQICDVRAVHGRMLDADALDKNEHQTSFPDQSEVQIVY
jgi:hypothetical protein